MSRHLTPRRPRSMASVSPTGPAPATITSYAAGSKLDNTLSGRRCYQEDLRRVEDPGVDEAGHLRLALKRAEGPGQAHPVEDFLLSAVLDGMCRVAAPRLVVAVAKLLVHPPV